MLEYLPGGICEKLNFDFAARHVNTLSYEKVLSRWVLTTTTTHPKFQYINNCSINSFFTALSDYLVLCCCCWHCAADILLCNKENFHATTTLLFWWRTFLLWILVVRRQNGKKPICPDLQKKYKSQLLFAQSHFLNTLHTCIHAYTTNKKNTYIIKPCLYLIMTSWYKKYNTLFTCNAHTLLFFSFHSLLICVTSANV